MLTFFNLLVGLENGIIKNTLTMFDGLMEKKIILSEKLRKAKNNMV